MMRTLLILASTAVLAAAQDVKITYESHFYINKANRPTNVCRPITDSDYKTAFAWPYQCRGMPMSGTQAENSAATDEAWIVSCAVCDRGVRSPNIMSVAAHRHLYSSHSPLPPPSPPPHPTHTHTHAHTHSLTSHDAFLHRCATQTGSLRNSA